MPPKTRSLVARRTRRGSAQTSRLSHRRTAGLTLVEMAVVVSVAGCVLAIGVPTFIAKLRISRLSEAPELLAALHARTASYYQAVHTVETVSRTFCLPQSAGPAPSTPAAEPMRTDFAAPATPGAATWLALGFAPAEPGRFRYTLVSSRAGCGLDRQGDKTFVTLTAEADLDGDGDFSRFERVSRVSPNGTELTAEPVLHVTNRIE